MKKEKFLIILMAITAPFVIAELADVAKADESANWGYLKIDIRLEGKQLNSSMAIVKDDLYKPDANDFIDSWDTEQTLFDSNKSGGYVLVSNKKLSQEVSANSSRTGKHIKGYFKGTIAEGSEPNMVAELTWLYAEPTEGRFGDMSLILTKEDSDSNNIVVDGYRGDLRAEMANSGVTDFASIPLGKAPVGTYTENAPYVMQLRLDFEKLIADLDKNNKVDFKDYAILVNQFGKAGPNLADITGLDGIPDGVVDYYDLKEFFNQWLAE